MKIVIFLIALLGLSACDSGTWVDAVGMDCVKGKPPDAFSEPAEMKMLGQSWCVTRQKNYTGEFQCKGDDLQFKCQ